MSDALPLGRDGPGMKNIVDDQQELWDHEKFFSRPSLQRSIKINHIDNKKSI